MNYFMTHTYSLSLEGEYRADKDFVDLPSAFQKHSPLNIKCLPRIMRSYYLRVILGKFCFANDRRISRGQPSVKPSYYFSVILSPAGTKNLAF